MIEQPDYKTLYLTSEKKSEALEKSNTALQHQVQQLQYQVQQLAKFLNGFKTERFVPAPASTPQKELGLVFEDMATPQVITTETVTFTKTKKDTVVASPSRQTNGQIPEHIRRQTTVLEPGENVSGCERVGEDITETLSWIPGEIIVKRLVRPRYSTPVDESGRSKIIQAPLPECAIPKCQADPSLLAHVTVDKFIDHKPLNRQLDTFKRSQIIIPYSTIADWVRLTGTVVDPFGHVLINEMLTSNYWHADETGIKVLDKTKKHDTHKGFFWTYMTGDGRLIYYDYQPGRDGKYPRELLKRFKGHLQTDGYSVYEDMGLKDITIFFCMAHARRKIFDAMSNDKARAEYALTEIKKLYAIEEQCREQKLTPEERKAKRGAEALPILEALGKWMKEQYTCLRPKTAIAQAFAYSIKRWDKLMLYATTPHLEIDNNAVERSMKSIAVGRKNYMFCGSHEAAKRAGLLYSLLVTCKLNNVNPYEWLKDILSRNINDMPINKLKELLPHNWRNPTTAPN